MSTKLQSRYIRLRQAFAIVVLLIVYGSLYPWDFIFDSHVQPLRTLLTSWLAAVRGDFPTRDFVVNVALYVPLGATGFLALRRAVPVMAFAAVLSTSIELAQAYHPLRFSNALDLIANVAGTAIGLVLARSFSENIYRLAGRWRFVHSPSPIPVALLLCWAAGTLFPFFPSMGWTALTNEVAAFVAAPFRISSLVTEAVVFFTLGRLLTAAGLTSAIRWLPLAVCVLPASIVIGIQQPSSSSVAGAITGAAVFLVAGRRKHVEHIGTVAILGVIVFRGLYPFDMGAERAAFGWIPFAGLLETEDGQRGLAILLEKLFYYGSSVWSLLTNGAGVIVATAVTAATLCGIEVAQMWLPGRTPESTDVVLAAVLGIVFHAIGSEPEVRSRLRLRGPNCGAI
jgi:VanZ family protein